MQKMQKCKNDQPSYSFGGFLKFWGSRWRLLEAILGDLGHKLGDLGGHVGLCWRILAKRWAMLGHLGAMLRHLGDKMRPKSAKMSPRWRPEAPRGANMSEKGSQHKSASPFLGELGSNLFFTLSLAQFSYKERRLRLQIICNVRACRSASRHPPAFPRMNPGTTLLTSFVLSPI